MTEIPEHLLQRSRERRAAMGGGDGASSGGDGGDSGSSGSAAPAKAAAAPAPSMPAHPAPVEEPPPPPPSPMVEAYTKRRKIPFWAMPVLAALPLWAYVYTGTLEPPPSGGGVEELGAELYTGSGCAGCHGASGGGGAGPAFADGAIYQTWPSFQDHFQWVRLGSTGWQSEMGATYGATNRPVNGGMPGFSAESLTDAELIAIVMHERLHLGGAGADPADAEQLLAVAEYLFEHPDETLEDALAAVGG